MIFGFCMQNMENTTIVSLETIFFLTSVINTNIFKFQINRKKSVSKFKFEITLEHSKS